MGEKVTWKKVFSGYVTRFVCFRCTAMLLVPQNVTEKDKSEMLPGASKPSG